MLTVYKASAGSGKTYTLTKLYLTMLLGVKDSSGKYRLNHPDFGTLYSSRHRNILAITFTNKATEEMKSRIVEQLGVLANVDKCSSSPYFDYFLGLFGCSASQLSKTAEFAMRELLYGFREFNVSTIDAFFQSVMRAMAFELDYPGNYEVVLDSAGVVSEAVRMMLDDFNMAPAPDMHGTVANALREFMVMERNSGKNFNIFNRNVKVHRSVIAKATSLFNEQYQLIAGDFEPWVNEARNVEEFREGLMSFRRQLMEETAAWARRFTEYVESIGLRWPADVGRAYKDQIVKYFDAGIPMAPEKYGKMAMSILEADASGIKSADVFNKAAAAKVADRDASMLHTMMLAMFRRNAHILAIDLIADEISSYRFMSIINRNVARFRADNNIIVLADTNRMLQRVMDNGTVPFVYEKMGVSLKHFLIDEFQDTSRMQWLNLKPLVENGLANGHDSLIIGDEKQSIYRFRNSDSSILRNEVADDFRMWTQVRGNIPEENTNWRSSRTIVEFNNEFFTRLAAHLDISGYGNVRQAVSEKHAAEEGYIRFFPVCPQQTGPDDETPRADVPDRMSLMIEQIIRQHDSGYGWGDIAVLTATRRSGRAVAAALLEKGIPVTTDEALLVASCPSVRLVVSVMDMLGRSALPSSRRGNVPDSRTITTVFTYFYNKATLQGLSPDLSAERAIAEIFSRKASGNAFEDIMTDIPLDNPSSLTSLVELIIASRTTPQMRLRDMPYISAFQDAVLDYTSIFGNDLPGFMRWWNTTSRSLSVAAPADADAVKVMTIHKAKGLQFACVHLPDGEYNLRGNATCRESAWLRIPDRGGVFAKLPPALLVTFGRAASVPFSPFRNAATKNDADRVMDGVNRVYVAYTRPERELCVYYNPKKDFGIVLSELLSQGGYPGRCTEAGTDLAIGKPTCPLHSAAPDISDDEHAASEEMKLAEYAVYDPEALRMYTHMDSAVNSDASGVDDVTPDGASSGDEDENTLLEAAGQRGSLMHYVLSILQPMGGSLTRALEHAISRARRRGLEDADADMLRDLFNDPALSAALRRWFETPVRALPEASLLTVSDGHDTGDGAEGELHRPDRIVWHDENTIEVVDYKFTTKKLPSHRRQICGYAALLSEIFPQATVGATLFYVDRREIVPVIEF